MKKKIILKVMLILKEKKQNDYNYIIVTHYDIGRTNISVQRNILLKPKKSFTN